MTLCVYAITAAGGRSLIGRGTAGERLRLMQSGAIAAIFGVLPRRLRPTEDNLRSYDRVMRLLAARRPIVPVRFGTCVRDEEELASILVSRQRSLRENLRRVRGRVQMTLRVVKRDGERGSGIGDQGSGIGDWGLGIGTGTAYLMARARATDIPGFEPVRGAGRRWVREERVEQRGLVVSLYHLIPRGSAAAYRAAIERAAAKAGMRVLITGPWPPYAFADTLSS